MIRECGGWGNLALKIPGWCGEKQFSNWNSPLNTLLKTNLSIRTVRPGSSGGNPNLALEIPKKRFIKHVKDITKLPGWCGEKQFSNWLRSPPQTQKLSSKEFKSSHSHLTKLARFARKAGLNIEENQENYKGSLFHHSEWLLRSHSPKWRNTT